MKKKLSMLLIFVLATGIFTSCANISTTTKLDDSLQPTEKTYTVLEAGGVSDSSLGIKHNSEISLAINNIKDNAKNNNTKEIILNDVSFSGKYYKTVTSPYYNRVYDVYDGNTGSAKISFKINSENNKIFGYSTYDIEYKTKIEGKKELTKEECIDIAKDYLKKYVDDVENYTITYNYTKLDVYMGNHNIYFTRYIDGIPTMDSAYIYVTEYGDIVRFDFNSLGDMKNVDVLNSHNIEAIEKAIDEKCEKIYGDIMNDPDYSVNISKSKRLVRMADGKYALEYEISAYISYVDSDRHASDSCMLIIYLE